MAKKKSNQNNESIIITRRRNCLKTKETWLVILGVIFHAIYIFSLFDIYIKTPIVHGIELVTPRFNAPAKRLVLIVADGLRADKFYEPDSNGNYLTPFLRNVIKSRGRFGVSHSRAPTESRPAHVAMIAGFHEDPTAMTKKWRANPVLYDSVFNRSRHTFCYGSVWRLCGHLPHSTWLAYPAAYDNWEDLVHEASFLDEWTFDQFQGLLNRSKEDEKLKSLLQQDKLVMFLHLEGCDANGHEHLPSSSIYLNNVKIVDDIAKRVYNLVEDFFEDTSTAYVFTADHGMTDKGTHGCGHRSTTETPLVVWGAGIRRPSPLRAEDTPTPKEWGLDGLERVDVNQTDIAPLMSTLLGLPCPANSIGKLPLGYINMNEKDEVEADLANTKQILNQFLHKSQIKQSHSLHFKPFKPLVEYSSMLDRIEDLVSARDYKSAMELSENLRSLAREGIHYFQTYDWLMLRTVITLGYIAWMFILFLHVLEAYTSLNVLGKDQEVYNFGKIQFCGILFMGICSVLLYMEQSPLLYHAYFATTVFLWTRVLDEFSFIKSVWRHLKGINSDDTIQLFAAVVLSIVIPEYLVHSFTERKLYTWCFLTVGIIACIYLYSSISWRSGVPVFIFTGCTFLSAFALMPAVIPENINLIFAGGAMITLIGLSAKWFDQHISRNKYWSSISNNEIGKHKFPMLFPLQAVLIVLASIMVPFSTFPEKEKQKLHPLLQLINWSIAGFSIVPPFFSETDVLSRLSSIFLGFAPPYLLLCKGYEAVFYGTLTLVLMGWILFEHALLNSTQSSPSMKNSDKSSNPEDNHRHLQLSDIRIPLTFTVLFWAAFFETATFESISTLRISSAYRFITAFHPIIMPVLYIFKLSTPVMLVVCAFIAITKLVKIPRSGCYFLVLLISEIMTIRFFFRVKNTGSWMEIGKSITHFAVTSSLVLLILLFFGFSDMYTKTIHIRQTRPLSSKKKRI